MKVLFKTKTLLIATDKWHFQFHKYKSAYIKGFRIWFGYIYIHYLKFK